ncbi:hypothetical protein FEM08_25190 [Flavobacterium gilvum]|nr:hypothetical protein FEM08_25190 [Flavobacterium gilvum]
MLTSIPLWFLRVYWSICTPLSVFPYTDFAIDTESAALASRAVSAPSVFFSPLHCTFILAKLKMEIP